MEIKTLRQTAAWGIGTSLAIVLFWGDPEVTFVPWLIQAVAVDVLRIGFYALPFILFHEVYEFDGPVMLSYLAQIEAAILAPLLVSAIALGVHNGAVIKTVMNSADVMFAVGVFMGAVSMVFMLVGAWLGPK